MSDEATVEKTASLVADVTRQVEALLQVACARGVSLEQASSSALVAARLMAKFGLVPKIPVEPTERGDCVTLKGVH